MDFKKSHFTTLRPILDGIGKRPCLIVTPMPRYVVASCCEDIKHVTIRLDRFYQVTMQRQLDKKPEESPFQHGKEKCQGGGISL
jgi:hypothetical protein